MIVKLLKMDNLTDQQIATIAGVSLEMIEEIKQTL